MSLPKKKKKVNEDKLKINASFDDVMKTIVSSNKPQTTMNYQQALIEREKFKHLINTIVKSNNKFYTVSDIVFLPENNISIFLESYLRHKNLDLATSRFSQEKDLELYVFCEIDGDVLIKISDLDL